MELTWNPLSKPKPGCEADFLSLFKLLRSLRAIEPEAVDRRAIDRKWHEITVNPYETLQAPRVGYDLAADQWALARYQAWQNQSQSEAEFMQEMQGFYVLQLVPPCDGLPRYSNDSTSDAVPFSFRAKLLASCEEIIGGTTLKQCYRSCLAPVLQGLGEDLQALAMHFAEKRRIAHTESASRPDFDEGSAEQKADVVLCAAKWCKYWSSRGHGLAAHWPSSPE